MNGSNRNEKKSRYGYLSVSQAGSGKSFLGALLMIEMIPSLAAGLTGVSNLLGAGSPFKPQLPLSE